MQFRLGALLLAILTPAFGRELVYLNNGFALEVQSHSIEDRNILCQTSTGTLEFQLSDVARIEPLSDAPVPSASVLPAAAALTAAELLGKAAVDQGLPPELIRSVAKIESGLRQNAISPKGAIGLMQLMPPTAAELGVQATRTEENAEGGAKYLRELLLRYHYDSALALAAYNAGPGAVDKYRGVPPYAETRQYVLKVLREYERQHRLASISVASASK